MTHMHFKKDRQSQIFKTIVFFDLFSFPLSLLELKRFSASASSIGLLKEALDTELDLGGLEMKNGFYFLPGRSDIVRLRQERYNFSLRKIKIAKFFAKIFFLLPSVLAVCLVNSIGSNNLRDEGDIDFLIITKAKRVWLSRFFCTGIAKVLNKRPTKKNKRDKICLSFYLAENKLSFSDLKNKEGDPYFNFWEKNIILLQDRGSVFTKLVRINNLEDVYFLDYSKEKAEKKKDLNSKTNKLLNSIFDKIESFSKAIQIKIMPKELIIANNLRTAEQGVVFSDDIIKLYLSDKRLEIKEKYEKNIK